MRKELDKEKKYKDSDKDGLSDYDEMNVYGSDPYDDDTNGDGVEDGEAVLNGKHPVTGKNLKDYFIPHEGNDYKPKALHHKRLLFHAGAVLLIKVTLLILVFFYPITAWMTPDVSIAQSREIITLTNNIRSELDLDLLQESTKLNQAALKKVEDMFINQYFAHVSPEGLGLTHFINSSSYNYIVVGENLAIGFESPAKVMAAWKNSPTHYNNLIDPNFSEIGVALAGGEYKDQNTFLTAQYFGLSPDFSSPVSTEESPTEIVKESNELESVAREEAIIAEDESDDLDRFVQGEVVENEDMESEGTTENESVTGNQSTMEADSRENEEIAVDNNIEEENDVDTTANPEEEPISVATTTANTDIDTDINTNNEVTSSRVLSSVDLITEGEIESDLNNYQAKITIDEPSGVKQDKVIKVEAYLPAETTSANLNIFNNTIEMSAVADDLNNDGYEKWFGQAVVQDDSDSVAPPIITLYSDMGNIEKIGVTNNDIKPQETSVLSQYSLFKNSPNRDLDKIFDISSMYFKILLALAALAMMLNVFIAIRKQRLKVILSGVGFIIFLAFMILI